MEYQVEDTSDVDPSFPDRLVHYDERARTYAVTIPHDPSGRTVPISYCPWCATKLRQVWARGLSSMSPETCRKARQAVGLTHRQVADAIGESLRTVFHYETGKPTDPGVADKLLFFFQGFPIAGTRSGRFSWYQM
jgi:hypothetical protein